MSVDITASDTEIEAAARAWLTQLTTVDDYETTVLAELGLDEDFGYESVDYEADLDRILVRAAGYSDPPSLFIKPDGVELFLDLIADRDVQIDGARYILAPPNRMTGDGLWSGVNLATNYQDLKATIDDRSTRGVDAVVSVITCAAREWARLFRAYQKITQAAEGQSVDN